MKLFIGSSPLYKSKIYIRFVFGFTLFYSIFCFGETTKKDNNHMSIFDAVKVSIQNNNNIKVTKLTSEIAKENIQAQEGQFDYTLLTKSSIINNVQPTQLSSSGDMVGINSESQVLTFGVQKQLKSSAIINLSSSIDSYQDEFSGQEFNDSSNAAVNFSLTFPLWRGRGGEITTLPLGLSKLAFDASVFDLKYQINTSILNTVTSYWNYRGKSDSLSLLKESENRSQSLLNEIQDLIDADELPLSELNVVKAQLSQRKGSRYQGEKNVVEAQAALSNSLGAVYYSSSLIKPTTSLTIPPDLDFDVFPALDLSELLKKIEMVRNDFSAVNQRIDIANKQIRLAHESGKPQLNLTFGGTHKQNDQRDDLFAGLNGDSFSPDWSVQLDFKWKPQQNSALAGSNSARAAHQQRIIERAELRRATAVQLDSALFSYIQSGRRYQESKNRQILSKENVENERKKLTLGSSTLLNLINIEDRLLQSELDVINEKINYGITLARLMFITGQLGKHTSNQLNMNELLSGDLFIQRLLNGQI